MYGARPGALMLPMEVAMSGKRPTESEAEREAARKANADLAAEARAKVRLERLEAARAAYEQEKLRIKRRDEAPQADASERPKPDLNFGSTEGDSAAAQDAKPRAPKQRGRRPKSPSANVSLSDPTTTAPRSGCAVCGQAVNDRRSLRCGQCRKSGLMPSAGTPAPLDVPADLGPDRVDASEVGRDGPGFRGETAREFETETGLAPEPEPEPEREPRGPIPPRTFSFPFHPAAPLASGLGPCSSPSSPPSLWSASGPLTPSPSPPPPSPPSSLSAPPRAPSIRVVATLGPRPNSRSHSSVTLPDGSAALRETALFGSPGTSLSEAVSRLDEVRTALIALAAASESFALAATVANRLLPGLLGLRLEEFAEDVLTAKSFASRSDAAEGRRSDP